MAIQEGTSPMSGWWGGFTSWLCGLWQAIEPLWASPCFCKWCSLFFWTSDKDLQTQG